MYLAQRISPCTSKESRKRRMQEARLAKSQRRVTLTPATGHSSLVTASHTRLLDLSQSCGTCGREASESRLVHLLKSLGLVAASRLGWNHVVTERRLHQFKQSCVNLRSPSTRAIVSRCIDNGVVPPFRPSRRDSKNQFKLADGVSSCSC